MSLDLSIHAGVAQLQLNRPKVLNALDRSLLYKLLATLQLVADDPEVKVILLRGLPQAFSTGSDLKEMNKMEPHEFAEATQLYQDIAQLFWGLRKPAIAALSGYVVGGGLELALMCHLRFAAENLQLSLPDAALGFSPSGGLSHLLTRAVGEGPALELLLTANTYTAKRALDVGLVSRMYPVAELFPEVEAVARRLAGFPSGGLSRILQLVRSDPQPFADVLVQEQRLDNASFADPHTKAQIAEQPC